MNLDRSAKVFNTVQEVKAADKVKLIGSRKTKVTRTTTRRKL